MHVLHSLQDGKVRVREVSGEELERLQQFSNSSGVQLETVMSSAEMKRLSAELDRPGPDLDALETSLRDGGNALAAMQLKRLLERKDAELPAPVCPGCGKEMVRNRERRSKTFTSRMGPVRIERSYYRCRGCGTTETPLDEWLKLKGKSIMPGAERMVMSAKSEFGNKRACEMIREMSGVKFSESRLDRETRRLGAEVVEFEQKAVPAAAEGPTLPVVLADGTGVPSVKKDVQGRKGKREGEEARTREAKVLRICEMERKSDGKVRPVAGTTTVSAMIDSAEVGAEGGHSEFDMRLWREALRRGVHLAKTVAVISDGAHWIENTANRVFAGQQIVFVLDLYHVLEKLSAALKELLADEAEWEAAWNRMKSQIKDGKVKAVIAELEPCAERHGKVREFLNYCKGNQHRMKYNLYRRMGIPRGSGAIESSCKHIVADRLKKSGCRWSTLGANGVMAIRCCIGNNRTSDFFEWRNAA